MQAKNTTVTHLEDGRWKLKFYMPVSESFRNESKDLIVRGVAINAGMTRNKHLFPPEELKKSAKTLVGKPMLTDHEAKVGAIIGEVLKAQFKDDAVHYEGVIDSSDDETAAMVARKIEKGRIKSVSVGAIVEKVKDEYDAEDNWTGVRLEGIDFVELSTVAVPADPGATIGMSFTEAVDELAKQHRSESMNKNPVATSNHFNFTNSQVSFGEHGFEIKPVSESFTNSRSPTKPVEETSEMTEDKVKTQNEEVAKEQSSKPVQEDVLSTITESLSKLAESQAKIAERLVALESKPVEASTPAPVAAPTTEGTKAEGVVEGVDEDEDEDEVQENNDMFTFTQKRGGMVDIELSANYGRYAPKTSALLNGLKHGKPVI